MYEINRAKTKHLKKAKTDLYRPNLWNFWRTTASLLNYWSSILNNFWYTNNFETNILHLEKLNWQTFWRRILNKIFRGYVLTVKKNLCLFKLIWKTNILCIHSVAWYYRIHSPNYEVICKYGDKARIALITDSDLARPWCMKDKC